ncbi:GD20943 [Drosophila simulans]|uniref:Glycerol-3-phosphate dehydrogenase [NAD(+)] n=1 Tax=Drosophila simulans TaxID=7240 RepID=B4R003_DROSI|nr:GD20943 [Drosophila simulans]
MAGKLKICIIGAEGWGSAIAAVVSNNVLEGDFDSRVHLYVYDEMIGDTALSEIINTRHENVKYLPGIKLPNNLIAVNDLLEAAQNADILVFSTPLEFVQSYCNILSGNVKESAFAVSMTKGLLSENGEGIELVSHAISESLDIPCYSMMSAHSAMEMAQGKLCEVTIGCSDNSHSKLLIAAMQTNNCRVISVNDVDGVELCGTLTDVVALGAGFIDGLGLGENARLAAVHLGVKEIMRFIKTFFPSSKMSTFYESCGVANAVASSLVDKNVTFAKSLITSGQTIEEIEANLHSGRKLLGPMVASNVNAFLENGLMQHEFPLFTAIHLICQGEAPPELMVEALRNHPDLSSSSISHLLKHEKDDLKTDQGLPELRTALDRILAEAGNENFKQLKVMDDWTEVNDYDVEETYHEKVASRESCLETEIMPSRLSVQAARLYNDIREGNVGVAFKMDIDEGNRQVRLLLEKDEMASDAAMTVISSRLSAGQEDDNVRMGHGHITNTSAESDHMASKGIPSGLTTKDSPDVLDLSCESEPLHSSKQNSQQMEDAETNFTERLKLKKLMFTDSGEPLESEKHIEMKLHDENDFDLDEEPAIGKKDRTYTKENLELEEMLEWQKLKQTDKPHHLYSSAELEDSTTIEGNSRLPIEHDDRFQNVDTYQDRELVQVRAENKEFSGAESENINLISEQRPNQNQDEVNLRPHSDIKTGETGHHEWDWLMNNEKIDSDEKKFYANERMETLSESDQDKLQNLNYQLKEALQHDLDVMSASRSNESNEVLSEEDSNPEAAKKITEQPNNPTPNQIPAVPLPVTMPSKQSHIREGSPQFQNQPKSVPPPSPQTKPQSPKEQQPRRTNAPVEFGNKDEAMDPNESASDQEVPMRKKISKTEAVIEPVARDVSMAEPNESLHSKKESSPASLSKQESKRKQKIGLRKPSSDSDSVKTTSEFEKQRQIIENQKAQLERMGKKISVMRRGQDRRVSYKGHNPYSSDPDLESRPPMDTSFEKDRTGDYQGLGHQRRKVVVAPPFHPPINPRVRVPRPPFDGRDHEFHTMTTAPVDRHLAPAAKWSSMPTTLKLNRNSLVANIQVKHFAALPSQAMPKPILKMPMGVPRTILCALQLGLLASYLACRKD